MRRELRKHPQAEGSRGKADRRRHDHLTDRETRQISKIIQGTNEGLKVRYLLVSEFSICCKSSTKWSHGPLLQRGMS